MTVLVLGTFGLAGLPYHADASGPNETVEQMLGSWQGNGTLFGRSGEFFMSWEHTPGDRILRLVFRNPVIEAEAFYRQNEAGSLEGTWFDSRGVVVPLTATVDSAAIETTWGTPDTEQGRTRYQLVGADSMEVTDFVMHNGGWTLFGEARYARARSSLEGMRWLLGTWEREAERSITQETWRRLSLRTFEGEGIRTSKESSEVVFSEHLLLVEMQGDLFYIAKVSENDDPVPFKLVTTLDGRIVFENPAHDFPQRIAYERHGDAEMTATLSGLDEGSREIELRFTRKP